MGNLSKAIQDHNKIQTDLFGTIIIPPKPRSQAVEHIKSIKINDFWETPPSLYRDAVYKFGLLPELDVCATEENTKCQMYFTKKNDAFRNDWNMDFFMNPPYGRGIIQKWIAKAWYEVNRHNVTGLALVFAKTDTHWWHDFVENKAEVHFIKGRIKFYKDGIESTKPAPYPSCWIIWRKLK